MESQKISIRIPSFTTSFTGGKEVAFYKILVSNGRNDWELKHRFSEFARLYNCLSERMKNLPPMPSKLGKLMYFAGGDINEDRREGLEKFVKALVERKDVYSSLEFIEFLEVKITKN